ncbi:hypothetical protein ISCGN_007871 [Ixodes scapularis]
MGMSAFGIAGPLFGYLSERWSYNTVLVGCTILTSTGIMLCYFAPSVAFITFFYGVVHDLARDRDVSRSQGIYLMHLYSVGDVVMRVVVGVIIDRGYLAVHSAMALGHLGNAIAFEALVWSRSTASLLPSAFLLGSSQGIICPLPAPMIIEDFGGRSMPILMGGMYGFMGLLLITMPPVLGYFKDQMGRYDGLLHALAILSGLVTIIWLARAVIKRSSIPPKHSNVHHDSGFCNRPATNRSRTRQSYTSGAGQLHFLTRLRSAVKNASTVSPDNCGRL